MRTLPAVVAALAVTVVFSARLRAQNPDASYLLPAVQVTLATTRIADGLPLGVLFLFKIPAPASATRIAIEVAQAIGVSGAGAWGDGGKPSPQMVGSSVPTRGAVAFEVHPLKPPLDSDLPAPTVTGAPWTAAGPTSQFVTDKAFWSHTGRALWVP